MLKLFAVMWEGSDSFMGARWTEEEAGELIQEYVNTWGEDISPDDFKVVPFYIPSLRETVIRMLAERGIAVIDNPDAQYARVGLASQMLLQALLISHDYDDPVAEALWLVQYSQPETLGMMGVPMEGTVQVPIREVPWTSIRQYSKP